MRGCSPSLACRSMRRARCRWCCFRRWTPRVDVPEITDGLLGHPEEVARQRDVRLGPHGGEAQGRRRARPSSPAPCCPTTRSSSSAARWPKASAPCASTIRTAPSSACWAARPAASDDGHRRRHPDPERRPIPRAAPSTALGGDHGLRLSVTVCDGGSRDDTTADRAAGRRHRRGDRTRSRPATRRRAPRPAARRGCCSCMPTRRCRPAGPPPRAGSWRRRRAKGRLLPPALRLRPIRAPDASSASSAWRCRTFGLPYGDQGLLIARAFYQQHRRLSRLCR